MEIDRNLVTPHACLEIKELESEKIDSSVFFYQPELFHIFSTSEMRVLFS